MVRFSRSSPIQRKHTTTDAKQMVDSNDSSCRRGLALLLPPLLVLVLLSFASLLQAEQRTEPSSSFSRRRVDVVLVGATSSLAKKYLFQSFFRSYLEEELKPAGATLDYHFYGAATRPMEEGSKLLTDFLASSTSCKGVRNVDSTVCEAKLKGFRTNFNYVQLRGEDQYKQLGRRLQQEQEQGGQPLEGRLFYLSISPDLYAGIAKSIAEHVRPNVTAAVAADGSSSSKAPWVRVVFEKPFGRDLPSAEALAHDLAQHLEEDEIYRVDHYMGKGVVQAILPFRQANKHWLEALWTGKHVASVEVSMKETEDCEGRTSFYEGYGVIRDVLQNHLTQVLVLLKMDLPDSDSSSSSSSASSSSSSSVFGSHHHRTAVLGQLTLFEEMELSDVDETRASIHVGQYQGYHAHVASDRRSEPLFVKTTVPTAASVTLASKHPRWEGARFTLKAGKALDTRTSYAKVVLCDDGEGGREGGGGCGCELLFNIQGGEMGTAIAWNRTACAGLIDPKAVQTPPGWVIEEKEEEGGKELHVLRPKDGESSLPNAYEFVVEAVLAGDRSMFLGTEELLHQWRVWDRVLTRADAMEPELYPAGFALDEVEVTGFIGVGAEGGEQGEVREEL